MTLWLTVAACGGDGNKVEQTLGPAGGTVGREHGARVQVPAGALTSERALSVSEAPAVAPPTGIVAVGGTWVLGPEGTRFAQQVTVTLPIETARLPAGVSASQVAIYTAPVGSTNWERLPAQPVGAGFVSARVSHFSVFFPGAIDPTNCDTALKCGGVCVDKRTDRTNCGACGVVCAAGVACIEGRCDSALARKLDLLVEIDNSNSMTRNQTTLMEQLPSLITALTNPPCTSTSNPSPHVCDPGNAADRRLYEPVRDLQVGVISTDLGMPGAPQALCANVDGGDEGMLNPIRYGRAMQTHLPWHNSTLPAGYRPADCTNAAQFPSFMSFASGDDPAVFQHDFRCNAGLYVGGCGTEQQLEAIYRALVQPGPTAQANAGFVRDDALLGILVLTDEEDGSVRDCRYAASTTEACESAYDVYNATSTQWGSSQLDLRFYFYKPGSAQDPTWSLDRYVDPRDPLRGLLALKPGHPERVIFAAVTGVPITLPTRTVDGAARPNWDALLGAPDPNDRENFYGRDRASALSTSSPEGPISMRYDNPDPDCPTRRATPACRRQGSSYSSTCPTTNNPTEQYSAFPSRRVVEIARRFDESPLCDGRPCHNGFVGSICASSYQTVLGEFVTRLRARLE